jgi:hypothetical protein
MVSFFEHLLRQQWRWALTGAAQGDVAFFA